MLLLLVAALSVGLAWVSWTATVDRRLESTHERPAPATRLDGSLTTDLTRSRSQATTAAAPAPPAGAPGSVQGPVAGGQSSGVSLPGPVMAAASVCAVLAGGLLLARLVLRRFRSAHTAVAVPPPALEDTPVRADKQSPHDETPAHAPPEDGSASSTDADVVRTSSTDDPAAARWSSEGAAVPGQRAPEAGLDVAKTRTPIALTRHAGPLAGGGLEPLTGDTGQRLYERRRAPRVDYVTPGVLEHQGSRHAVTVLDLSESGLRCQAEAPSSGSPTVPATNGEYVRISFELASGPLDVKAQVAWRRTSDAGVQLGVTFVGPRPEDVERIRETCSGHLDGTQAVSSW